jgi:hypothetical protein
MESNLDCHYSGLPSPKAYDMENNKTAMRQMIDYIDELKSKTTNESEKYLLTAIWTKAFFLLDVETEQMFNNYGEGYDEGLYAGEYK